VNPRRDILVSIICFFPLWLLLDRAAAVFGSLRGEAGIVVLALALAATVVVEASLFHRVPREALRFLGYVRPDGRWLGATVVFSAALLLVVPLYASATRTPVALIDNWPWLALGMAAQGGLAEETVFRGFLFRHLRQWHSFWRAALISAIPFAMVHLLLFATLDLVVALAALAVSVSLSFPLARLFERGGFSIWLPAMVHFVVQAGIKLVAAPEAAMTGMAIAWMAVSAAAPWLVFLVPSRRQPAAPIDAS
jgi:membrane protease YdiL (CAAX protease family)